MAAGGDRSGCVVVGRWPWPEDDTRPRPVAPPRRIIPSADARRTPPSVPKAISPPGTATTASRRGRPSAEPTSHAYPSGNTMVTPTGGSPPPSRPREPTATMRSSVTATDWTAASRSSTRSQFAPAIGMTTRAAPMNRSSAVDTAIHTCSHDAGRRFRPCSIGAGWLLRRPRPVRAFLPDSASHRRLIRHGECADLGDST